jgi:hypothetical protein
LFQNRRSRSAFYFDRARPFLCSRLILVSSLSILPDFVGVDKSWVAAMNIIGTVESLWRYPVTSMHGEEVDEIFRSLRLGQVRLQLVGSISKDGVNSISKEGATLTS